MKAPEQPVTSILESIPDGLAILDRQWRYSFINRAAEPILGRPRADLLGKCVWEVFPQVIGTEVERQLRRVVADGVACAFERYYPARQRWFENRACRTEDGGLAVYFRDITDRKRNEENLRRSEALLSEAQQVAHIGSWNWDLGTNDISWSDEHYRIVGLRPQQMPMTRDQANEYIHPDDRAEVWGVLNRAMREQQPYECTCRVVHPNGGLRFVQSRGRAVYDEHGVAVRMFGTIQDVTERKKMEDALAESNRHKDEFLAMLGHELRNPLAPLRAVMETLRRSALEGDELERVYAMMDRQVSHLTRLVDDLLDVSRITRGLVELRKGPVELADPIHQAIEMATPAIERRGHELMLSLPRKALRVEGDATRLTQVFFNLVSNAVKFTDAGGRIWLTAEREDGMAVVRVRDDGNGMAPELVPRVFDLFTQGQRTLDRSQGGLGLGLPLVRQLVEMHGGRVEARSEGPRKGSEFVVRLPALPAQDAQKRQGLLPSLAPEPTVLVGSVLVVDDNLDVADCMVMLLQGLAGEVRVAHSGAEAIDVVHSWRPDVVLMDIGMPGMDGYEAARRLRLKPGLDEVLIVAVTGYGEEDAKRRSREAGFDRHLVKPLGGAMLRQLLGGAKKRLGDECRRESR